LIAYIKINLIFITDVNQYVEMV